MIVAAAAAGHARPLPRRQEPPLSPTGAQPPIFDPPCVYVLDVVRDDPAAARRAERLCAAFATDDVRTIGYADLPDVVAAHGWDRCPRMGTLEHVPPPVPILGVFRFDREAVARDAARMQAAYGGSGSFPWHLAAGGGAFVFFCSGLDEVRPNPHHVCRPQWRIHQGRGCPHQCAYCHLGGFLISHVNTEQYVDHLGRLLAANPWQKTFLYDDVMDVLTLEPQHDTLAPLMRFFQDTGDRYLIVHTKSDRVDALIHAGAPRNTIVVWSLAGPRQASRLERLAGTTRSRVEAARRCQDAGLTVRYKFKPIVPLAEWRAEADEAIDLALTHTRPDNLSMTVLMWMTVDEVTSCIPPSMLDAEFLAAARAAAGGPARRTDPFPRAVRETIYRHYLGRIRSIDPEVPVTLSTESLGIWWALGPELGFSPSDYVCGCGAGATPGKRRLETDPWADARAARRWDGSPPLPGGD